jgi:hypothetical protein
VNTLALAWTGPHEQAITAEKTAAVLQQQVRQLQVGMPRYFIRSVRVPVVLAVYERCRILVPSVLVAGVRHCLPQPWQHAKGQQCARNSKARMAVGVDISLKADRVGVDVELES